MNVQQIIALVPKVSTEDMSARPKLRAWLRMPRCCGRWPAVGCTLLIARRVVRVLLAVPGQTFIRQGFYPDGMFMIARGRVNILVGDDKQPAAVRYPGDYVGEKSLLTDETAKATCCTADWCTLFLLRKRDFLVLCNVYPDLRGVVVLCAPPRPAAALAVCPTGYTLHVLFCLDFCLHLPACSHMKQRESEDNKKERLCMRQQMNEASVKPRGTKSTKQSTRQSTSRLFGFDLSGLEA
jgi:hypothetical protein